MFPGGGRWEGGGREEGGRGREWEEGVERGGELEVVRREGEGHMGREGTEDTALLGVGKNQPYNILSFTFFFFKCRNHMNWRLLVE